MSALHRNIFRLIADKFKFVSDIIFKTLDLVNLFIL